MKKIIVSVQNTVNLTAQTPSYMGTADREVVGISSADFNLASVLALGDPSKVCLIHIYLSFATESTVNAIRELNKRGYVIMISLTTDVPSSKTSFLYQLGIINTTETWNANHPLSFHTKDNTFFNVSGYTSSGVDVTYKEAVASRNFGYSIPVSILKVPVTTIATTSATSTDIYFGIVEPNTQLNGFISLAPLLLTGFLYAAEKHTSNIYNILTDIYTYADIHSKAPFVVEGFVATNGKTPLKRLVSVHKQSNGALINSSNSGEDGFYRIGVPSNEAVFVVCHPEDSNKRGLIHTHVIPLPNED